MGAMVRSGLCLLQHLGRQREFSLQFVDHIYWLSTSTNWQAGSTAHDLPLQCFNSCHTKPSTQRGVCGITAGISSLLGASTANKPLPLLSRLFSNQAASSSSSTDVSQPSSPVPGVSRGARKVNPFGKSRSQTSFQEGIVHINNTSSNIICTLTDTQGSIKAWTSGGSVGFKNAAEGKPLAAEKAAEELARKALRLGFINVIVKLKGVGRNKVYAAQALARAGLHIKQLQEVTAVPYNGCRLPRKRRV